MASDRHGKHNKPTIAFRVTPYEQQVINERVKASGMKKQDYIVTFLFAKANAPTATFTA